MIEDKNYHCNWCKTEWEFFEDVLNCPCKDRQEKTRVGKVEYEVDLSHQPVYKHLKENGVWISKI